MAYKGVGTGVKPQRPSPTGQGPEISGLFGRKVQLPDERAGTLMVFRSYDRLSYALIMEAEGPIHILDKVRNPS